jgi:hypothetical protein
VIGTGLFLLIVQGKMLHAVISPTWPTYKKKQFAMINTNQQHMNNVRQSSNSSHPNTNNPSRKISTPPMLNINMTRNGYNH